MESAGYSQIGASCVSLKKLAHGLCGPFIVWFLDQKYIPRRSGPFGQTMAVVASVLLLQDADPVAHAGEYLDAPMADDSASSGLEGLHGCNRGLL